MDTSKTENNINKLKTFREAYIKVLKEMLQADYYGDVNFEIFVQNGNINQVKAVITKSVR